MSVWKELLAVNRETVSWSLTIPKQPLFLHVSLAVLSIVPRPIGPSLHHQSSLSPSELVLVLHLEKASADIDRVLFNTCCRQTSLDDTRYRQFTRDPSSTGLARRCWISLTLFCMLDLAWHAPCLSSPSTTLAIGTLDASRYPESHSANLTFVFSTFSMQNVITRARPAQKHKHSDDVLFKITVARQLGKTAGGVVE